MLNTRFGTEIEFTGITRNEAAKVVAKQLNGTVHHAGGSYDAYHITAPDRRVWKVMFDSSITPQKKVNGQITGATDLYKCELVTPILRYEQDINTLQEILRQLRHRGAFVNARCGIHIHLDGAGHNLTTIKNFIHIIYARNDLFYKALNINPTRQHYCKKLDKSLVDKIKERKPETMSALEDIWYEGYWGTRTMHYNDSRYHFLNLDSLSLLKRSSVKGYAVAVLAFRFNTIGEAISTICLVTVKGSFCRCTNGVFDLWKARVLLLLRAPGC